MFRTPIVALALVAVSMPAGAACGPYAPAPDAKVFAGVGTFYVDSDNCQSACIFHVVVYQESNGVAGLQRSDFMRDDTCATWPHPDELIVGVSGHY